MLKGELVGIEILSRSNNEKVIYENCYILRDYKSLIQQKASELGGTMNASCSDIFMPTSERLHELVQFIEDLIFPSNTIVVAVQEKKIAEFPKTQKLKKHSDDLLILLSLNNGTKTKNEFSFSNLADASTFVTHIVMKYLY